MKWFLENLPYILVAIFGVALIGGFILPLMIVLSREAWQWALM